MHYSNKGRRDNQEPEKFEFWGIFSTFFRFLIMIPSLNIFMFSYRTLKIMIDYKEYSMYGLNCCILQFMFIIS